MSEDSTEETNVEERYQEIREGIADGSYFLRLPHVYDELAVMGLHISLLVARKGGGTTESPYAKAGLGIFVLIPKEIWNHIFEYLKYEEIISLGEVCKWTWSLMTDIFPTKKVDMFKRFFPKEEAHKIKDKSSMQPYLQQRRNLMEQTDIHGLMWEYVLKAHKYEGKMARYGAKSGDIFDFDISEKAMVRYGLKTGDRVQTKKGPAGSQIELKGSRFSVTIGVRDGHLWFHIKGDRGASYWPDPTDMPGLNSIGIFPLTNPLGQIENLDLWPILEVELSDPTSTVPSTVFCLVSASSVTN